MTSKRKCKFCGAFDYDHIKVNAGSFCNMAHAIKWSIEKSSKDKAKAQKKAEAAKNKEHAQKKREFYDKDLPKQKELTQKSFNKLRKLEEFKWFKDRGLEPSCISCGKYNMDWCCGHFKTVAASGALRYERKNTFLQCNRYCNKGKSGNIEGCKNTRGYKNGLKQRFGIPGLALIDWCEDHQADVKRWTCEELIGMRKEFNENIRQLEIELEDK